MGILKTKRFGFAWGKDTKSFDMQYNVISDDDKLGPLIEELNEMIYPVSSIGRQSIPDYKNLAAAMGDMLLINPEFNAEWIEALECLALWDPDVSNAIENVSIANTTRKTFFDEKTPESVQKEAQQFLTESRDTWYPYGDGYNGFVDDILVQCAYSGAISFEILVSQNLDSVNRLEMVNPKNIVFYRDQKTGQLLPIQKVPSQYLSAYMGGNAIVMGKYKKLNTITYRYSGLRRFGENPIAIPPMLAGMEGLMIKRGMQKNLTTIVEKLGVLGFLKVMMEKPTMISGESKTAYQSRLKNAVDENIMAVQKGFANNFMMGWKTPPGQPGGSGGSDIDFFSATGNVTGAEKLFDINDSSLMNGLKQPLEMMNRKNNTTETFGRVILAKMTTQMRKYQTLLGSNISYIELMHLKLAGFPVNKITTEFEAVMLGDKVKEQQARSLEIDNAAKLYNDGIIDQAERANILGYDEPDQDEPRIATPGSPADLQHQKDLKNAGNEDDATNPKSTDKNVRQRLPMQFINQLISEDETGHGYHIVDITLSDGEVMPNVIVSNAQWAYMPHTIELGTIKKIEVKKKDHEVTLIGECEGFLRKSLPPFNYCEQHYADHHHGHSHLVYESYADKKERSMHKGYNDAVDRKYQLFVADAIQRVAGSLASMEEGASIQQVTNAIIGQTYLSFNEEFRQPVKKVVREFVTEIYTNYRKMKAPFQGRKVNDAVFNLQDFRTMDFYRKNDDLYLGKFITDADTRNRLNKWIQEQYFEKNMPIGKNSAGISKFKNEFGDTLIAEDWKIRRILDTTVNKLRNYGAVSYMQQVGIEKFVVRSIPDKLRCDYCKAMDGKVLFVNIEYEKVSTLTAADPMDTPTISPFLTSTGLSADDVKGMSGEALQGQGIGAGGYHPHCRCTVVIDIE